MNPLLSPTPLEISPAEEQAQMLELAEQNDASLYDLQRRKANIERKRQDLAVDSKERNLEAVEKLNEQLPTLVDTLLDPDLLKRVKDNTKDGLGYEKLASGVLKVIDAKEKLLDKTYDDTAQSGKKKKIDFAFQGGGYRIGMRIEADE